MRIGDLTRLLQEADLTQKQVRQYAEIDSQRTMAFRPAIRPCASRMEVSPNFESRVVELLNSYSKRWRQKQLVRKLRSGFRGLRIVSEGDSWFQYPLLRDDIIDHLFSRYAILSLGEGGDTLATIMEEKDREIIPAIQDHEPHLFLVSGGGNDMVGNGRLFELIRNYAPDLEPDEYMETDNFQAFINDELVGTYKEIFDELLGRFPKLDIIVHGYDRPIPVADAWLGKPLSASGILDPSLQRAVIAAIMDRYNQALAELARNYDRVHHADCRGSVKDGQWDDALHPNDQGFARAACRINRRIKALTKDRGWA